MSPSRNRNAERLYGYPSAEAVGGDITRLIVHPDDIPALDSIIGNIFRGTGKCWRGNFPVKKKSGERFFVVADATPLHDDGGNLMGLVCLSEDTQTLKELTDSSTAGYYYANQY
jgi:PAS domain S-box-containing protein